MSASPGGNIKACFDRALSLARQQGARLFELRAAISAAELLASTGARRGARVLLDDSIRPFRDCRDLPDLRRARALLLDL